MFSLDVRALYVLSLYIIVLSNCYYQFLLLAVVIVTMLF